jgi:hypothetical protein
MDVIGKDFKYKLVDKFLTNEEVNILHNYTKLTHTANKTDFSNWIPTGDTWYYCDALMESLLMSKINKVENICGKKLFPTYSFWRMYTNQAEMAEHTDRPSCEISITINLGGDKPWAIYMDDTPITLNPGQAVIYLGQEISHYRKLFDGDYCSQVFLHYVDQNGPNAEYKLDKRGAHWVTVRPKETK